MDIYVLHDGKEIGPLSTEKTWQLLNQGSVLADDLAWSPGMGKWEPLSQILPPAGDSPPAPAPEHVETSPLEISTAKQRALLAFLHVGFTSSTSKQEAALLISDALENPAYAVRLAQWPTERLKLHGDLFSAELQARRENRAHHYQMLAQSEGAALFNGVTKAHAQNVITHLDLASPNWEANESTAARDHFFPALAEKFPDLVRPDAQKTAQETSAPPPRKTRDKNPRSGLPIAAMVRGLFFGALVVGIGWFVMKVLDTSKSPSAATPSSAPANPPVAPEPPPTPTEPTPAPAAPPTPPPVAESTPSPDGAPPMPASPTAPMAETPAPTTPPTATPAPVDSPAPSAAPPPAPTTLLLTKPFAATLTYGAVTLPPGTSLRLISQEGALLKVQYLNNVFLVPASATNHSGAPAAPPGL